ncbi:MAG: tetratricopeptide repeat-containing sensor histidine kinase [Ferruginibacter sp.]
MKNLLLLLFLTAPLFSLAQSNKQLDSLLIEADKDLLDSVKLDVYNEIGFIYTDNNASKAIGYFEKVNELAKKVKKPLKEANSYYDLGFSYLLLANYEKSLENYLLAARGYEKLDDKKRMINAYMSVGNVHFDNDNIPKANEYYRLSEAIARETKDSIMIANVYNALGNAFDKSKNYDSALHYLNKANDIFQAKGGFFDKINILSNLGLTNKHINKTAESLTYFEKVIDMVKSGDDMPADLIAQVYNNLGSAYSQAKNYGRAKEAFDTSIIYSKKANLSQVLMENYRNVSDMYGDMKDYKQEAFYLREYYNLKDSLFSADKKNQLTQLEADYQLEKKNSELVKKDAEVVKRNSERNILFIIALAAAILLAGLAFFYSRIRKKNQTLNEQNSTINKQNTELQTLNSVKDRLFSIISHDLRNPLVTLQNYLTLTNNETLPAEKKEQLRLQTSNAVTQTSNMLDNLLAWANMQIRNTKANITLVDVDDLVADTKGGAMAQASQKQIIIHEDLLVTSVPGDYNILSIALRNLLTNAIKFSDKQGNIWINAAKKDNEFMLSVKDDGIGMTQQQLEELKGKQQQSSSGTAGEKGSGLGLYLVTELLSKINARLEIQSEQGVGSTFSIVLPA